MAETPGVANFEALVRQLEELPIGALEGLDSDVESLLSELAVVCRDATVGSACNVINAREFGARACQALLRLPVTLYSEAIAAAFWEVARST